MTERTSSTLTMIVTCPRCGADYVATPDAIRAATYRRCPVCSPRANDARDHQATAGAAR